MVGDVKANSKDFYRCINGRKKDALDIPPLKQRNGSGFAQSESEKAAEFNGQLMYSLNPSTVRSLSWIDQSLSWKILLLLWTSERFEPSEALGPDELHPRVIKELATE